MASDDVWKPEEYLTYHKLVFRETFDFLNAHFPPQNDPQWWLQFAKDTSATSEKLKGGRLLDGILLAIGNYLDEEYKKRRGESG